MSSAPDTGPNALVARCAQLLELLCGAVPHGMSNKAIADALRVPPSYVTRAAADLAAIGWVEKLPSGNFCVTTRFSRLSFRVLASFEREQQRLGDMQRNFTLNN
ncbi:helix-turn-helix domain-containing protein [Caldimonas sp. KR1-144]|uniref:helix-turn-helix domain-containing protein n=1 Tax=Caldimonas sp. KR1-144 TaxID=3400911 RepID=UPI003BFFF66B